jgi:hypothetical protein
MTKCSDQSRRWFIKSASLAVPIMIPGFRADSQPRWLPASIDTSSPAMSDSRNYLGKNTRLSISMWDFSWLESSFPGGPFEDLERCVAEAAERGYNTLRVDCFPSRVIEPTSSFGQNWTAGSNLPAWGMTAKPFSCNVRERLRNFADLCRKYSLWMGLDSWDKNHMFTAADPTHWKNQHIAAADEERAFTRYGELWGHALKAMREDGILERAVWIAPMNEVPHFGGRSLESVIALQKMPKSEGETRLEVSAELDAIYRRLNDWMVSPIKSEVAKENIPLSYSSLGAENYAARMSDFYDVVDIHFMPGVIEDEEDRHAFLAAGAGAPNGNFHDLEKYNLKEYSIAWDHACRKHYPAMLKRVSSYFTTALEHTVLPSGKRLQAIITEPYGPCYWPDSPLVSWEWYKRYNADALRVVASMNFAGASLSNYAEPLFTLWDDRDWHWAGNNYFRTAPLLA